MRTADFTKSFVRLYRKLDEVDKGSVDAAIDELLKSFEGGPVPKGLGLKKLSGDLWEVRVDLSLRLVFLISRDRIEFGAVGDHEAIRKCLKNV